MHSKLSKTIGTASNFQRELTETDLCAPIEFFSEIFRWILLKNGEKRTASNVEIRISCIPERVRRVYIRDYATRSLK